MSLFRRNPDPIGPLDYARRFWLRAIVAVTLFFLYAPILGLIAFSFNDSRRNVVWRGFTTDYYVKFFNNEGLMIAFGNSLTIAVMTTVVSTILGALTAYVLWRYRFPGKAVYEGGMALPIVIPEICMGVAMMVFFARIGWPTGLPWPVNLGAITIAHIAFAFPFTAIVIRARLENFNRELAECARDLGANEYRVFRDIVVPHMKPGLIAGALLAFTLSARRLRHHLLHRRARHRHLPGQDLLDGAFLGDTGSQRRLDRADPADARRDHHRAVAAEPQQHDR